ncbi:1-acyl-sn-glycerol-3-phosphate acyltransferase [Nocardioides sp.]|uniref:lysophospholipid acyltransferase family protein n=1 Tax=Nocardioides sp. TaxID=35761 RepID=UPI002628D303|nr:lysophospholipid acyltransferase family protein [Nocardioides sp.]
MDLTYPVIVAAAKTWFKVSAMDIHMTGAEHIPTEGGALVAVNHVSYVDYLMGGYPGAQRGRYIRFMAKKEIFDSPLGGPFMRSFGHLEVDREAGAASMRTAVDALRKGELVGIFPEATISQSFLIKELKSGAVRIAADAEVPLIPIVVWGTQRILAKGSRLDLSRHHRIDIEVGEPMHPTGADPAAETAELKRRMEEMLERCILASPPEERPAGAWWLPQQYGGSAPTIEEAAAQYAEERRRRAEAKAAKRKR